jgi:aarF domain-containing kinase
MMSGKRLLDAVALFNATRAVAYNHLGIRRSQFELYARTSSLTRGIDRAGHFRKDVSNAASSSTQNATGAAKAKPNTTLDTPDHKTAEGEEQSAKGPEGIGQDQHYPRSQENSVADSTPDQDLEVRQDKTKNDPPTDGTIQFVHKGLRGAATDAQGLSPEDAMRLQRQSEAQIPSEPAEPPTAETFSATGDGPEFGVEQEQDVFHQPPGSTAPVLSALPRFKIPKTEEDVQGGDPHVPQKINADVFYSSRKPSRDNSTNQQSQEDLSEETISSLFHSKRVARLLGAKLMDTPGGIRPRGSRMYATRGSQFSERNADFAGAHAEGSETGKSPDSDGENLKRLAADLAMHDSIQPPVRTPVMLHSLRSGLIN